MDNELYNDYISQGIALMSQGSFEAAKTKFEEASKIEPRAYEAYVHIGNACANLEQYDDAVNAFKNALVVSSNEGETLYALGNIYLLKDDKAKAVEYYNKAEEAGYKTAELYMMLATIFYDADDVVQALRNINRAIAVEPLDGELRLFKARIFLAENKYDEALETLEEMQKILPDAFEAYDLQAQIYSGFGENDKALELCDEAIKRFPMDANVFLSKLRILVETQKDEKAKELLKNMHENGMFEQVEKEATVQEVILLIKSQNIDGALELLKTTNDSLGGDADLTYMMLDIYGKVENYEKTYEVAEQLLKLEPEMYYAATAKYFRAHSMQKLGKQEEAKAEYKKLTTEFRKLTIEHPSFYEGYIYRLLSHNAIGEYEKALELTDYLENMYPERTDAHAFRYFVYKEKGDMEKAEAEKQAALSMDPNVVL